MMILDKLSSIAIYFNSNLSLYWDKITPCSINSKPHELGRYYMDFTCKFYYNKFDGNNIPIYKTDELKYFPTVICQYAMGVFEFLYKSDFKDNNLKLCFLNQVNWLMENCIYNNDIPTWKCNFDIKKYGLVKPWNSALVQSEVISVLLRAYLLTKNENYLMTAEKAMNLFEIPVKDGGILNYLNGFPIYEEYPSVKPNFVLNGFIFSLFGLYDFSLLNNYKASKLFQNGIDSIIKLLPQFDLGTWTQYNLFDSPAIYLASYRYHLLHIEQLKVLYYLTGNEELLGYSQKWEKYSSKLRYRLVALSKKILR